MKNYLKLATALLMSAILSLNSCKVEPEIPAEPISYVLKISIDQLPGTATNLTGLFAVASIIKENGETVVTDKSYELEFNSKYVTSEIPVAKGTYKLTKLLIKKADGTIIFATPIAGSAKATQIAQPLAITTSTATASTTINLAVLPVSTTDRSHDFGYADGTFNEQPIENELTEFSITIKPSFTIGSVVYDSIPTSLKLTTYPINGEPQTIFHVLSGGLNKITLSKKALKYTLNINKWGIDDSAVILPNEMKDGLTYTLGGNRAAKKLKYESVYKQSGTLWVPETRKEYLYADNGRLNLINHYKKAADNSTILDMKEEIIYENNRVSQIKKSVNNQNSFFTYGADGKLAQLHYTDNEGQTTGKTNYQILPGGTTSSSNYSVTTTFESKKFYYKQQYTYEINRGNVLKFNYATTHGDLEETLYQHDSGINPFIHLQLPELGFISLSKNNVIKRFASYHIAIPTYDAYSYSYVYDSEGYPIELYTKYRIPGTATEAFSTKTVFNYY
jgi:hypothetical protein